MSSPNTTTVHADAATLLRVQNDYAVRDVALSVDDTELAASVRHLGRQLAVAIVEAVPESVERSIALQKVHEAFLWTQHQVSMRTATPIVDTTEASA